MLKQKWILIIVAAVLAVAIPVAIIGCVGPQQQQADPAEQYVKLEGDALHGLINSMSATTNTAGSHATSTIDIIPSETLFAMMGLQDMDMTWAEKLTLKLDSKVDGANINALMNLGMNGKTLLAVDMITNPTTGISYLAIPTLSSYYLKVNQNNAAAGSAAAVNGLLSQLNIPETQTVKNLLNKYIDIILANMTLVEMETEDMTVGDKTQSVTVYKNYITEKVAQDTVKAVLTEVKKDETIKSMLPEGAELTDAIDEMLSSMNAEPSTDKEDAILLTVYVNGDNEIIGRAFSVDRQVSISYLTLSDESGSATELAVTADTVQYVLSGSATANGGSYTLSMRGDGQNVTFGTLSYTGNSQSGSAQIRLSDFIQQSIFATTEIDPSLKIDWRISEDGSAADIDLYLYMASQQIIGIETSTTNISDDRVEITVPGSSLDITNPDHQNYYLESLDFDTLQSNMLSAGIPSELVDAIMAQFAGTPETAE